ncbi:16S rRNA (uracil(1498)-N(3))-methyltransferase [Exiguobacterium sp. SH5S13]|uniref:16S rRNA (uracil(1498)-N(3))-methyltransferase n=1 Tax=Exiguobacterium sp. SH5S13 TaxID=2510959 RepID=UPI00103F996A|nr:16S rRNA (uracil(1498)-N(3))-methyltransferase [Exiguobacterium sp. SH5S13]TCI55692.1 16S rRNA (uracil(1498)-N(3))-methyltransferase [Exiguobacterium sp. SH5S13]
MQRYFLQRDAFKTDTVALPQDVVHHIGTVLREGPGYRLVLLDGTGFEYEAEVVTLEKKTGTARVLERRQATTELPVEVTLAYALPKGDKIELVAQKATELGLHHLWVFESKRSVAKWDAKKAPKKLERLQKIMQEAAEQSYRAVVPTSRYMTPRALTEDLAAFDAVVIAYEEEAKQGEKAAFASVLQALSPGSKLLLIVGPEGGFTESEVNEWTERGARVCAFGPRILRSETAPLYALAAVSYALELN